MENFGKGEFTNFDGKKWKKVGVSGKLAYTLKNQIGNMIEYFLLRYTKLTYTLNFSFII